MASENALPLTITVASLPVGFVGTPQELADAIAERIEIVAQQSFALFSVGATEPSYDTGPWAKNGNTWYYFDSDAGAYLPFEIPQASLGYQISVNEPTEDGIVVWFQVDNDGLPLAIKTRSVSGGAIVWTSVYYLKSETYSQAETNNAIARQIRYAVRAKPNADQTISIDSTDQQLDLNAEILDPDGAYTEADSEYIAPIKGIYEIGGVMVFDNDTGTPAGMEIEVSAWSDGVGTGTELGANGNNTPSPNSDRWHVPLSIMFQASAGAVIELSATAVDGVNSGDLTLLAAKSFWTIKLVQAVD